MRRDADAFYLELADGGEGGGSFHDIFNLDYSEALIEDFACAISRSILLQGRMYITQDHVCFHSSLFGHRTIALLHFESIGSLRKVTHALINPGIEIVDTDGEVYSFASFFFRDHTFKILKELWRIHHRKRPLLFPPAAVGGGSAGRSALASPSSAADAAGAARSAAHRPGRVVDGFAAGRGASPPQPPTPRSLGTSLSAPGQHSPLSAGGRFAHGCAPPASSPAQSQPQPAADGGGSAERAPHVPPRPPERRVPPAPAAADSPLRLRRMLSRSSDGSASALDDGGREVDELVRARARGGGGGVCAAGGAAAASLSSAAVGVGLGSFAGAMRASALPEEEAALEQIAADAIVADLIEGRATMLAPLEMAMVEAMRIELSPVGFWARFVSDSSEFVGQFRAATGGAEVCVDAWRPFPAGGCVREVRFVQPIRSRMSPVRRTRVLETERCCWLPRARADGSDGGAGQGGDGDGGDGGDGDGDGGCCGATLVLQFSQVFADTPYGDYFTVEHKWVVTSVGTDDAMLGAQPPPADGAAGASGGGAAGVCACMLSASVEVMFQKPTWLRSKIVQGCADECREGYDMLAAMVARAMAAEPSPARRGSGAPAVPTLAAPARAVSDVDSAAPPPVAVAHSADGARAPLVRALSGGLSGRLSGGLSGAAPPFDEDLAVVRGCDEVYENQWLAHASHAHQRAAADGGVARSTRRSHEATRPLTPTRGTQPAQPAATAAAPVPAQPRLAGGSWLPCARGAPGVGSERPPFLSRDGRRGWARLSHVQLPTGAHGAPAADRAVSASGNGHGGGAVWEWDGGWQLASAGVTDAADGGGWRYAPSWRGPWTPLPVDGSRVRRRRWVRNRTLNTEAATGAERFASGIVAALQRLLAKGANELAPPLSARGALSTVAATAAACVRLGARQLTLFVGARSTATLCALSCCVGLICYPLVELFIDQTNGALTAAFCALAGGGAAGWPEASASVPAGSAPTSLPLELAALADGVGSRGLASQVSKWVRRAGGAAGAAGAECASAAPADAAELAESIARLGGLQRQLLAEAVELGRMLRELQ